MSTPQTLLEVRVLEKREAATDVLSLTLVPVDGGTLPAYRAGAHIDIALPNGLVRQYSLCKADRSSGSYEVAILRDRNGRGGSECAHRDIQEGTRLRISPPRNLFPLQEAPHTLLLAGGIGITPILAMAEELDRERRDFKLHYCARSPERAAYRDYLSDASWSSRVRFHYDSESGAPTLDTSALLAGQPSDTRLYVCGPAGFIKHIWESAAVAGWDESRVHFEHFSAPKEESPAAGGFELVLGKSGISISVPPDKSAAQAILDAGVEIPLSCEQGVCGACVLPVLEGTPDHRDMFLSPAERSGNRCFTPCCSRSLSERLVIDL